LVEAGLSRVFAGSGVDVPVVVPWEVPAVGSAERLVFGLVPGAGEFTVVVGVLILYRCAAAET
jgi:hypothetical protein